jgi:hypothetical protein
VVLHRDDDVLDVAHVLHQPYPTHDVLLRFVLDKELAAGV